MARKSPPSPKTEVVTEVHELESWMTRRWRADEYASPEFFRSSCAIWVAGGFSWVIYQRAFGTCNLTHIDYITDGAITYMYSLSRKIKRSTFNLEQKITMKISRCLIIVGVQHSEETWYRKMITVHVILTCKTVAELPWAVQKVIFAPVFNRNFGWIANFSIISKHFHKVHRVKTMKKCHRLASIIAIVQSA